MDFISKRKITQLIGFIGILNTSTHFPPTVAIIYSLKKHQSCAESLMLPLLDKVTGVSFV